MRLTDSITENPLENENTTPFVHSNPCPLNSLDLEDQARGSTPLNLSCS